MKLKFTTCFHNGGGIFLGMIYSAHTTQYFKVYYFKLGFLFWQLDLTVTRTL